MIEKLSDFTWHLEFYRHNADGTRTLTQKPQSQKRRLSK
jgi:hypothetical protein